MCTFAFQFSPPRIQAYRRSDISGGAVSFYIDKIERTGFQDVSDSEGSGDDEPPTQAAPPAAEASPVPRHPTVRVMFYTTAKEKVAIDGYFIDLELRDFPKVAVEQLNVGPGEPAIVDFRVRALYCLAYKRGTDEVRDRRVAFNFPSLFPPCLRLRSRCFTEDTKLDVKIFFL